VHLAVLWSFAFAQPLFQVLADSPEFFVARGNTSGDILLLALGLVLIPPTALLAVELALTPLPRVRKLAHLVFVGALATAVAMQIFKGEVSGPGIPLTALAVAFGAGAALLYERAPAARSALTVLAPAPLLFLCLFLFFSPVSDLFESDDDVPVRQDVRPSDPVVVLVFDEFSVETLMTADGDIDAARYPNLAALSESGTWFRNATTISDHTTDAVPGILSATYPDKDAVPTATDHPRNLFTLLGGAYSLRNVSEPATDLCPSRICEDASRPPRLDRLESLGKDLTIVALHRVLPNRLAAELPAVNQGFGNFANQGRDAATGGDVAVPGLAFEDRPGQFERLIDGIDGDSPHSLSFLHVLLPHTPWQYLPNGQAYTPPAGPEIPGVSEGGIWTKDPALPLQSFQRSVLQAGYADLLVGRLVERLRSEGLYDRTLLVVTADHGISFRPASSRRTAQGPGAADVLGVPLFVKVPHQREGGVDDRHATTADVIPTVAEALDIDLRWRTDGRSLLGLPRPPSDPVSVSVFPSRERVELPFEEYVRARDSEVKAMRFRQGPGEGWAGIYAPGADSDLFGRPVSELTSGTPGEARVALERASAYDSVEPRASVVPAFVNGTITGAPAGPLRVAVAVNGVIRAVAPSYDSAGEARFGTLVPPSSFRAGRNEVRIYLITGAGESRRTILLPRDG
jgi:hypothetical protein